MELKWLEDFQALAEHKSFSKAARSRHVTQPAFSRRIRALENWLNVSLVDRDQRPLTLTQAGLDFIADARHLRNSILDARNHLQLRHGEAVEFMFLAPHTLAVTFFPRWLENIRALLGERLVRMQAGDFFAIRQQFMSGVGDFLLCFSPPSAIGMPSGANADVLRIGTDQLVPVSVASSTGRAKHEPQAGCPLKLLAYPEDSFLGEKIGQACLVCQQADVRCQPVLENALADGLKALVLQGHGVAWLPKSLIETELREGLLIELGPPLTKVPLEIYLYRSWRTRRSDIDPLWEQFRLMTANA